MTSDIEHIHHFIENQKKLLQYLEFQMIQEINRCKFYRLDDACEEYCDNPKISGNKGLSVSLEPDAREHCRSCEHREIKPSK